MSIEAAVAPNRPVLRWHGGKWKLAPWKALALPKQEAFEL